MPVLSLLASRTTALLAIAVPIAVLPRSKALSSATTAVTPVNVFNSAAEPVTAASLVKSAWTNPETPSNKFSSVAVEVTATFSFIFGAVKVLFVSVWVPASDTSPVAPVGPVEPVAPVSPFNPVLVKWTDNSSAAEKVLLDARWTTVILLYPLSSSTAAVTLNLAYVDLSLISTICKKPLIVLVLEPQVSVSACVAPPLASASSI